MFSVALDIDVNHSRAVSRVRARRGRSPIPFLCFLFHHDRNCPCNTGYFRPLPFPPTSCISPGLLGSRLFCVASARLALTYEDTKLILFLALLERLVRGPRPAGRALGRTALRVAQVYSFGPHSPPISLHNFLSC